MSAFPWTDKLDAELLALKRADKPWSVICPRLGCDKVEGQRRYTVLTNTAVDRTIRVAMPAEPVTLERDGLGWLIRKNRLSPDQRKAGLRYQAAFKTAVEGEASIQSFLAEGLREIHTAPGSRLPSPVGLLNVQAKRDLFRMRHEILRGQTDMLTVMDGVCGVGWTLRELAGGNDRLAGNLEAVLKVALDLIAGATVQG